MGSIFVSRLEREMQGSWIWCNFSIPVNVKQKFRWWWNLANGILISLVSLSFTDYFFIIEATLVFGWNTCIKMMFSIETKHWSYEKLYIIESFLINTYMYYVD